MKIRILEDLLEELNGRLTYLENLEKTVETKSRISEINLVIVKVQSILLDILSEMD